MQRSNACLQMTTTGALTPVPRATRQLRIIESSGSEGTNDNQQSEEGETRAAGPHRSTETLSICDTFKKIFTIERIDVIVRRTNKKSSAVHQEYNAQNPGKTLT